MPNIKQQKKRVGTAARERLQNLRYRSTVKTLTRRLESAVADGDSDRIASTHKELQQWIDRATSRGALHRNAAARKKAQAARLVSEPVAPPTPGPSQGSVSSTSARVSSCVFERRLAPLSAASSDSQTGQCRVELLLGVAVGVADRLADAELVHLDALRDVPGTDALGSEQLDASDQGDVRRESHGDREGLPAFEL